MFKATMVSLAMGVLSCGVAPAAEVVFQSGPARTHLLELFTSEGCSSCPPAEARFSKFKTDARLWKDFVPVAFHVDYWDRLGWPDRFASKAWTERQRTYAAGWNSSSVYTPGFVLNGREWRGGNVPAAASEQPGVLKAVARDDGSVAVSFEGDSTRALEVNVATLGVGLSTNVKAGENSGRKLSHDFVVLDLAKNRLEPGMKEVRVQTQKQSEAGALALWITEAGRAEPLQAAGGFLR